MSRLTKLFIDAASENIELLPKRLGELGVRYPEGARGRVRRGAPRALSPLLRRDAAGDRPDPDHPGGVRVDLLDEPPAADALRDARQGDRHARLGRRRALSRLQRVRGGEAVRARPDGRALHAAAYRRARAARGLAAREHRVGASVPALRHARAGSRRPDRGRLRPQGPRRVHGEARRAVQPARDRARRDRRPHRLEPDRDLRQAGPHVLGLHVISVLGFLLSAILGVWLLWSVIRSGRI